MPTLEYNTKALALLNGFLRQGRMPHAFLIEGPAGCGKKTMAQIIAQSILCTANEKPCGLCLPCIKVEKQIHPDVSILSVPPGKKQFPVDTVRALRERASIAPNESEYKLYILEQAHMMNNEAQNALLKLLEEPPPSVKLILLCENRSMMLPTILSRVICISLEVPGVEQCAALLHRMVPERDEQLCLAAAAGAGGNVGRALSQLDEAKPSKCAADARGLCQAMAQGNRYDCLRIFASYDKDREGLLQTFSLLEERFAHLAAAKYRGADAGEKQLLSHMPPSRAISAARSVAAAAEHMRRNGLIGLVCASLTEEIIGQ